MNDIVTIEFREVSLSKQECSVGESIDITALIVFTGYLPKEQPAVLPYGLEFSLGGDEFE